VLPDGARIAHDRAPRLTPDLTGCPFLELCLHLAARFQSGRLASPDVFIGPRPLDRTPLYTLNDCHAAPELFAPPNPTPPTALLYRDTITEGIFADLFILEPELTGCLRIFYWAWFYLNRILPYVYHCSLATFMRRSPLTALDR